LGRMIERRFSLPISLLFFTLLFSAGCVTLPTIPREEYEVLCSAASASSSAVIGEYGENVPPDFSAEKFMGLVEGKIPASYFAALQKFSLEVRPKAGYYLLLVFDPDTKSLILFDYSCTPAPDGQVLWEPAKYDRKNLERYDPCKEQK
jgi:hypothetical protein